MPMLVSQGLETENRVFCSYSRKYFRLLNYYLPAITTKGSLNIYIIVIRQIELCGK
jgi:hypothetical protein